MGRENRTGGFRALVQNHILFGFRRKARGNHPQRARRFISPSAHFQGLEALEDRILMSVTPTLVDGVLTCSGIAGETNAITVSLVNNGASIEATVDGSSATFATASVQSLVINAGTRQDAISISPSINCDETLTEGKGLPPSAANTGGNSGSGSSGSGTGSSGSGSSNSNSGSSTGGSGTSTSGSSGSGSSSSHSGSSNSGSSSSNSGSSSSGGGSSGSGSGSNPVTDPPPPKNPGLGGGGDPSSNSHSGSGSGSSSSNSGSSHSNSGSSNSGNGSSSSGAGAPTSSGSSSSSSGSSHSGSSASNSGSSASNSGSGSSNSGSSNSGSSASNSGSSSSNSGSSSSGSTGSGSSSNNGGGNNTSPSTNQGNPTSGSSTPDVVITNTTPSGTVYPEETVNVNAMSSSFGSGTSLNSTITWNFGDPSSQYNVLNGFSAAHAYASAGTYTITLTITTPDGHVGKSTTQVTIAADNRTTIYVSPNGSDSNNGLSPNSPIQTIDHLNQISTSNERILFQDGGTYDMPDQGINVESMSHVYIGSYGSGAQPIIMYTGPYQQFSMVSFDGNSQSIAVQGLTFNSIYSDNQDGNAIPTAAAPLGKGISILDNTFLNLTDDVSMNNVPTDVLVEGNNSPDPTALNAYFTWIQGYEIAVIGNSVANSVGESIIRVGGETDNDDILIADNNLANLAGQGGDSNDISKATVAVQGGFDIYIYNNTFNTGVAGEGPLGTDTGSNPNATVSYVVFDSNTAINGATFLINPGSTNTMFKNNVVYGNGINYGFGINSTEVDDVFNLQVQNLWIVDNTVIESGNDGGFLYLSDGESQNVVVNNNVFVGTQLTIGGGSAYIYDTNDDMNSFSQIQNNVWGTPGSIDTWTQGGLFFISSDPNNRAAWLTPAQWEATGIPTGDVYETVNFGSTLSVSVDGFTAGSDLPNTGS